MAQVFMFHYRPVIESMSYDVGCSRGAILSCAFGDTRASDGELANLEGSLLYAP